MGLHPEIPVRVATLLKRQSGMMRKYHVPFWRAVKESPPPLTLVIRTEGSRIISENTAGHAEFKLVEKL